MRLIKDQTVQQSEIAEAVRDLCSRFPDEYWRKIDQGHQYADEFVEALTTAGWLSILIPTEYGGGGLGLTEATTVLKEINRSGGNAAACHAQMYTMAALLRHGSVEQKNAYLPKIAEGSLRLQSFAVTEPDSGSDLTRISTFAKRNGSGYRISGQKIFISRVHHSDLMVLLARTTPLGEVDKKTDGISLFLVDLRESRDCIDVVPIETMINHETNQLFIEGLDLGEEQLIGKEGEGFRYVLDNLNAERILLAAESIGDGLWFSDRAARYVSERHVFGSPIGRNQGVQFPISKAYISVKAAELMCERAAITFDDSQSAGELANMAKYLASEAAWEAANACMDAHGGYGFAVEYDIERKFRESRLYKTAPVTNNLILAFVGEHVLGMPRSY